MRRAVSGGPGRAVWTTGTLQDVIAVGVSHRTAPLEVRERWAFSAEESRKALDDLKGRISFSEHLILSTCNRTEFYSHFPKSLLPSIAGPGDRSPHEAPGPLRGEPGAGPAVPGAMDFCLRMYMDVSRTLERKPIGDLDPSHFYLHRQEGAIEHLFRLAGGLESMILGESQILKQIKDAFALAQEAKSTGKLFHKLFPAALRVGKRVRSVTSISDGCITPGQAALELARGILGDISERALLVIGSGKIATSAALAFQDQKLRSCHVINRTPERAAELIERLGRGEAADWSSLHDLLLRADIVVSSTGAVEPIVTRRALEDIQARRGHRPLLIVDLAVPRDFDPNVRELRGVSLLNIDDLNTVIRRNVAERHTHVPVAEEVIREELRAFQSWMTYAQIDPVLRHLVERFDQIRLGEVQAYISQFPPEYHPLVQELTTSLMAKLLHFPIEKLKSLRDLRGLNDTEIAFLKRLFLA